MNGVFGKQKLTKLYNILGLFCGVFLVLMFGAFVYMGEYATWDYVLLAWFFIGFGVFISVLCAASLYVNGKAFIYVDERKISAFCHYGLTLECDLSEVDNVTYNGTGLNIKLKNGKKYNVMNLENARQLGMHIRKRISAKPEIYLDQDMPLTTIRSLRKLRKREGIAAVICFLLFVPEVFITCALTGWKELHEFSADDWTGFAIMFGVGVITLVAFCILLRKYLLHTEELCKIQGARYQRVLHTTPLQPGNAIKLFVDDDVCPSSRLTVYGFPDSKDVYYTVEHVNQDFEIECVQKSGIYPEFSELEPELEDLTEIPLP